MHWKLFARKLLTSLDVNRVRRRRSGHFETIQMLVGLKLTPDSQRRSGSFSVVAFERITMIKEETTLLTEVAAIDHFSWKEADKEKSW